MQISYFLTYQCRRLTVEQSWTEIPRFFHADSLLTSLLLPVHNHIITIIVVLILSIKTTNLKCGKQEPQ